MHLLVEQSVCIHRPAQSVFEFVSNMEHFGLWFPGVIGIESSNALVHGQVGKEYLETVSVPFRGRQKITLQVREVVQTSGHYLFATEGRFPPLLPRMEISISDVQPTFCQLTCRIFSRNGDPIIRFTLHPLVRRLMGQRARLGLAALKERMENGCAAPLGQLGSDARPTPGGAMF